MADALPVERRRRARRMARTHYRRGAAFARGGRGGRAAGGAPPSPAEDGAVARGVAATVSRADLGMGMDRVT